MCKGVDSSRPMKTVRPRPPIDIEPELGTSQIARHFNLNEATILRWVDDGMPVKKYNQRLFRYKLSEVEKWLKTRGASL